MNMQVTTINKNEPLNFKESKKGYMGECGDRKGK